MVKCPNCGENIAKTDKRCPICGKSVSDGKNNLSSIGSSKTIIAIVAIIAIIAIVGVLASGMFSNDSSTSDTASDSKVVEPTVKEDTSSNSDSSASSTEYWASAKADKFHLPSCEWAEKISDDNKIIYDSREDAIADGKEPCGVCNP